MSAEEKILGGILSEAEETAKAAEEKDRVKHSVSTAEEL